MCVGLLLFSRPEMRVLGQRIDVSRWTERAQLAGFMAVLGPAGWRYHTEVRPAHRAVGLSFF